MLSPAAFCLVTAVILFTVVTVTLSLLLYNLDSSAYYGDSACVPLSGLIGVLVAVVVSVLLMMWFSQSIKGLHYTLNYYKHERDKAIELMAKTTDADDKAILANKIISLEKDITKTRGELKIPQTVEEENE